MNKENLACLVRGSFLIAWLENCKSRCPAVQGWWNVVVECGGGSRIVTVIDHHFYRLVSEPHYFSIGLYHYPQGFPAFVDWWLNLSG